MSLNTNIHTKLLANICLPMTHDTGTFDLSDLYVDQAFVEKIEEGLAALVVALNDAGIVPYGQDPLAWLLKEALPALKGLTTATKMTVGEQLQGGIRGFDFRLYNENGVYYTHHGLRSSSTFESMIDDIQSFLIATTNWNEPVGEIVYVNMSHYLDFGDLDYIRFGHMVKAKLGGYAYRNYGNNDPFNATYQQIIGQDGQNRSRVILVSDTPLGEDETYFWPSNYCPPDEDRTMNVLYGMYTHSDKLDDVIQTQVQQFNTAVSQALPFVNYMTMTPSDAAYANIIGSSLYGAFFVLASDLRKDGFHELADAADLIAAGLLADVEATNLLGWRTLEELEEQIDSRMPELVDDNFLPYNTGDDNLISMIFCDFWENSEVVDLAIALSNDFEMKWTGNEQISPVIGGVTYRLSSTEGPTAAMYREQLLMVYKDSGNDDMWLAVCDPQSDTWFSNQKIKDMTGGGSLDATTNKSPAAAVFNDQLYVVWKSGGSNAIQCATWDGMTWAGGGTISITDADPETNNSPYLAVYKGVLYLVYKYEGNDRIRCATYVSAWTGGGEIEVDDNTDKPYPETDKRPALVEYGGLLYLMYKGEGSNELYQTTYDGANWSGNVKIKNDAESYDPKSNEGPGLSRFAGDIYMPYKGESDDMWISYYNGDSWNGNIKIDVDGAVPTTNRGPWAVRAGLELFLLEKRANNELAQSILKPIHF